MDAAENVSHAMFPLEELSGIAHYFTSLPLHPFHPLFSTVHFILTAFALRSEPGGVQYAQLHPIASCVMTFLVASSGGILANIALGRPPVECILDIRVVATSVLMWYLIFFSPFDICYGLCHFLPVNLILWIIKELARAKKVYSGVKMAANVYPNSLLAMAIVGMFKGSGKQWGIVWYHLVFNPQSASRLEILGLSYITKSAFTLGMLLAYNHMYLMFDPAHLVLLGGCVMVGFKLWILRVGNIDPFLTPQDFTWKVATSLSITHPHREVGIVAMGAKGVKEDIKESSTAHAQEKKSATVKHLKDD